MRQKLTELKKESTLMHGDFDTVLIIERKIKKINLLNYQLILTN